MILENEMLGDQYWMMDDMPTKFGGIWMRDGARGEATISMCKTNGIYGRRRKRRLELQSYQNDVHALTPVIS